MPECHIKGTTVKYIRIPDEVFHIIIILISHIYYYRFSIKPVKLIKSFACNKLNFEINVIIIIEVAVILVVEVITILTVIIIPIIILSLIFYQSAEVSEKVIKQKIINKYKIYIVLIAPSSSKASKDGQVLQNYSVYYFKILLYFDYFFYFFQMECRFFLALV